MSGTFRATRVVLIALAGAGAATGAVGFCPYCGKELAKEIGLALRCHRCGREFTITPIAPST